MTEAFCSANQWTGFYMITAPVMKEWSESFIEIISVILSISFSVANLEK